VSLDPAVAAVRRAVRPAFLDPGEAVLVACSGGADSLALLAAAIVEASTSHAEHVVTQMAELGADETVAVRVQVEARGQGPEAAARQARYAVLGELAQRFGPPGLPARVLLGHTLDDQAETVLLGLARGSGTRSLSGMRRGFDGFSRPLLDLTRAQTEAACRALGIAWWTDPHNADRRYARSRVRHEVLPVLERELGPGVAQALARTARQCRADADYLDDLAEQALAAARLDPDRPALGVRTSAVEPLDPALASRLVRRAALEAGALPGDLTLEHVGAVEALTVGADAEHAGRQVQLPGHVTAYREDGLLKFRATAVAG
jgi:tRNA(Ile)-lysidine synthase